MTSYGVQTLTGVRHQVNEDAHGALPGRGVWVVADGMGGHAAGDVASQVARDSVLFAVERKRGLVDAIADAHAAVVRKGSEVRARRGMGSTVVAAHVEQRSGEARIAWVGDSRAYLWRDGELRRLTRDHSLVQQMVQQGRISPAQAETHPDRNVLLRCLGFEQPSIDQVRMQLEPDDLLLLCTDGVTGELNDRRMAEIVADTDDPQACADALIEAVRAQRGGDDATAIVIRYSPVSSAWIPVLAGALVGVLAFSIWMWMRSS
ncbi:MAG: PP2C family protein-serine/threonine phosphatase [Pseudomonadales bacterium]|jgi:protein phosphatase